MFMESKIKTADGVGGISTNTANLSTLFRRRMNQECNCSLSQPSIAWAMTFCELSCTKGPLQSPEDPH